MDSRPALSQQDCNLQQSTPKEFTMGALGADNKDICVLKLTVHTWIARARQYLRERHNAQVPSGLLQTLHEGAHKQTMHEIGNCCYPKGWESRRTSGCVHSLNARNTGVLCCYGLTAQPRRNNIAFSQQSTPNEVTMGAMSADGRDVKVAQTHDLCLNCVCREIAAQAAQCAKRHTSRSQPWRSRRSQPWEW